MNIHGYAKLCILVNKYAQLNLISYNRRIGARDLPLPDMLSLGVEDGAWMHWGNLSVVADAVLALSFSSVLDFPRNRGPAEQCSCMVLRNQTNECSQFKCVCQERPIYPLYIYIYIPIWGPMLWLFLLGSSFQSWHGWMTEANLRRLADLAPAMCGQRASDLIHSK